MSCNIIKFKRGGTFRELCTADRNISGWGISSQIRRENGDLIATLTATITQAAPTGIFELEYIGDTSSWPLEILRTDILYSPAGRDLPTETFYINVVELISR